MYVPTVRVHGVIVYGCQWKARMYAITCMEYIHKYYFQLHEL